MDLELLDAISELQIATKKEKAIINAFFDRFVEPDKMNVQKEIALQYDDYTYTAHVILDLFCKVKEKVDELEQLANKAAEKAV